MHIYQIARLYIHPVPYANELLQYQGNIKPVAIESRQIARVENIKQFFGHIGKLGAKRYIFIIDAMYLRSLYRYGDSRIDPHRIPSAGVVYIYTYDADLYDAVSDEIYPRGLEVKYSQRALQVQFKLVI